MHEPLEYRVASFPSHSACLCRLVEWVGFDSRDDAIIPCSAFAAVVTDWLSHPLLLCAYPDYLASPDELLYILLRKNEAAAFVGCGYT